MRERKGVRNLLCEAPFGPTGKRFLTPFLLLALACAGCQNPPVIPQVLGAKERGPVEVTQYHPHTVDGWDLELRRYRAPLRSGADKERLPVILCHGRTCSANFWDLAPKVSFARYLAENGYDVWVPSLRGSGTSTKPGFVVLREMLRLRLDNTEQLINFPRIADPTKFDWNFEDYYMRDIPAIIDVVKRETKHTKVLWIGHSMGGMVMYPYLERSGRDDVAGFVPLGSPVYMPQPPNDLYQLLARNPELFEVSTALFNNQLPTAVESVTGAEFLKGSFYYSPANVDKDVMKLSLQKNSEDTSTGVTGQLLGLLRTGHLRSADGKIDYTAELDRVKVPILLVAGKADNMAEPTCVRYAYEHVGSTDKTYRELGVANNYSADYGHMDIILGRKAPDEVYPYLLDWLNKHDRP